MKKRIFAVLFAMMMLAGCGGEKDEHADHDHAEEQKQEVVADDATSKFLQSLPAEIPAADAVAEGFYTIHDDVVENQVAWDAFLAAVAKGEAAEVMVCQYTEKGGAVLDHVSYDVATGYTVVTDTTRDGYNDEKSLLKAPVVYTDLKMFENFSLKEGGKAYTICVLSDNPELTEDNFRTEWINMTTEENHIYLLFVI